MAVKPILPGGLYISGSGVSNYNSLTFPDTALPAPSGSTYTLTRGQSYYGTIATASATIAFTGSAGAGGPPTVLRGVNFSQQCTLTIPSSYRQGAVTNPITTLVLDAGYHTLSWVNSNGVDDLYDDQDDTTGFVQSVNNGSDFNSPTSVPANIGALAVANNLSDVNSVITSFDNLDAKGADIASATTTDLSTATGSFVNVTGTTTITGLGTLAFGLRRWVRFTGILTLTHNGTSLILPGSANITTAAGDYACFESGGSGNWRCVSYNRANGTTLVVNAVGLNTAQTNVTWTVNSSGLSLNAGGYAGTVTGATGGSLTVNTAGVSMNLPAYLTTAALSQNTSNYAGINSAITGGSMTVNTSGVSVNVPVSAPQTLSGYENVVGGPIGGATTGGIGGSTAKVFPFNLHNYISASYIRFFGNIGLVSTSFATSAVPWSTTFSNTVQLNAVIYSQGTGGSSRSLQYVTSASAGWTWQLSVTAANATNNWTVTANMTWPSEGANTANTSWNSASTLSTINISTTDATYSQFGNGNKYADIPFAASLSPGNYWMAVNEANGTVGGQGIAFNLGAIFGHSDLNSQFGAFNSAANSSNQFILGLGGWSTNSIGATTSSIALANISTLASHFRPYFQFIRQA